MVFELLSTMSRESRRTRESRSAHQSSSHSERVPLVIDNGTFFIDMPDRLLIFLNKFVHLLLGAEPSRK